AGGGALQVDEEGHDVAAQDAAEGVEEGGLAHAALAVEDEGQLSLVEERLLDLGADVGAAGEDVLLLGEGDAEDVGAFDFLGGLGGGGEVRDVVVEEVGPAAGDLAEARGEG